MADHSHGDHDECGVGRSGRWVFWGFVLVAALFLIAEHRAHVYQYLPLLLLLACPLMHLFHGHGGHGSHRHSRDRHPAEGKDAGAQKNQSGGCH